MMWYLNLECFKILNEHSQVIDELKAMEFDITIGTYFDVESLIAKALGTSFIWSRMHLIDPELGISLNQPTQAQWTLPLVMFSADEIDTADHNKIK